MLQKVFLVMCATTPLRSDQPADDLLLNSRYFDSILSIKNEFQFTAKRPESKFKKVEARKCDCNLFSFKYGKTPEVNSEISSV